VRVRVRVRVRVLDLEHWSLLPPHPGAFARRTCLHGRSWATSRPAHWL